MEQFNVTGMSCAACSARVEKAVKSVPGVTGCSVSLLTNSMGEEGTAEDSAIIRAVEQAGYGASPKKAAAAASTSAELDAIADHETPKLKRRLIASLGFLLVLFFSIWLDWLPPFGRDEPGSIIMPVITLSLMSLSVNARLLRSSMLEVKGQRYVLWAAMRGLPGSQVTVRHVLRNAMLPLLTAAGMHLAELIGWSMVVETIFAWPGVGRWSINAIYNRDFPVLQCFTMVMTTMFVLMNLGIDILCAWLDPRIRYSGDSQGGH